MTARGDAERDLLEPLDGEVGPAPSRSAHAQRAMAQAVVQRAAASRKRKPRQLGRGFELAAAAVLALVLAGSAWAAVVVYGSQAERSTPRQLGAKRKTPPPRALPHVTRERVAEPLPPRPAEPAPAQAAAGSRDSLERANRLRASRRWRAAERAYAHVARDYAGSDEAYAALIAAATLRLEHTGRPRDALAMYQRALALRPKGGLVEQARHGIAEAHRALGQRAAEARALRSFLDAHPDSLRAAEARARLSELERNSGF